MAGLPQEARVSLLKAAKLYGTTQRRSSSPTHSWYYGKEDTGNYNTGYRNWGSLTSGSISIPSNVSAATLQFEQFLNTENTATNSGTTFFDTATVELSVDNTSWTPYVKLSENPGWHTVYIDIPSYYFGKNTYVRFTFDTVDSIANNFEGWFLDDIKITGMIPDITPTITPTPTPAPVCNRPAQISLANNSIPRIYPGNTYNSEFILTNRNDLQCSPATYSIGKGYLYGWTLTAPYFVTLNAGETKNVPYSITVASDAQRGIYNYSFDVDGAYGTTEWIEVIIANNPPFASAGPDQNGFTNQILQFDSYPSYDPEGPITYLWDFGDGSTSTEAKPSHAYSTNKTYTVTLTVTDQEGLSSQDSLEVNIANDTVTITKAVYSNSKKQLTIEAVSNSNGSAVLTVTGIGQMTYDPVSKLYHLINTQKYINSVAVQSSFSGSSSSQVTKIAK